MSDYVFGLSEFTTWPWSFEEDLRLCIDVGIPSIEVTEFKLDRAGFAKQLRSISENGLGVSSVQMTVHSLFKDSLVGEPPDEAHRLQQMKASIERIAPHVPEATPFVVITGAAPDGNVERTLEACKRDFAELAEFTKRFGMRLALEPLNPVLMNTDTAIWSLDDALRLVEDVGHDNFGLCVDFWNIWQTADVKNVIERAGPRIFVVQTSDYAPPRANADRRNIGAGQIPMTDLVSALRRARFDGPYVLEIFSSQSLPDSIWSSDLRATVAANARAFDIVWQGSSRD